MGVTRSVPGRVAGFNSADVTSMCRTEALCRPSTAKSACSWGHVENMPHDFLGVKRTGLFTFSVDSTHRIFQDISGHTAASDGAKFAGGAEVNAGKDAGIGALVERRGKTRIVPGPPRQCWRLTQGFINV